eukprot:scaffold56192_cov17-Tisochrysis_lutea.AAC.2
MADWEQADRARDLLSPSRPLLSLVASVLRDAKGTDLQLNFPYWSLSVPHCSLGSWLHIHYYLHRMPLFAGVNIADLLSRIGLEVNQTSEQSQPGGKFHQLPRTLHQLVFPKHCGITQAMAAPSCQVGTFAIAYAAHKALSPVRFPPTVALTPVVAKWIGKDKGTNNEEGK